MAINILLRIEKSIDHGNSVREIINIINETKYTIVPHQIGDTMKQIFSNSVLYLLISITLLANDNPDKTITAYKLDKPLSVDGILDEPLYSKNPIDDFTQKEPTEGLPTTEKTLVWISYDESNIYFSGKFYDSHPDSIDQSLMRRDNIVNSDWLWIYIDPYNDDRSGYYFSVNPGGSICDGTLYNDGWMDESWDGIWKAETNVDDEGWTLEVRIPFSQLRFTESDEMVWGINLNRDIKRKHEMSFYVMVPNSESGFVSKFADLKGLNGVVSKQRFELLPYIVQKAQYLANKEDDPFYKSNQYKTTVGGDIKLSLGTNLNIDATINPDFGQVEVDPAMVNLTAFENYYDEKRPFFIEGKSVFEFGTGGATDHWGFNFSNPTFYYSRRIGRAPQGRVYDNGYADFPGETRILGAAKLTGKVDDSWSIGVLSAVTERTFAKVQTENDGTVENEVEPLTNYSVVRTQKEFNEGRQALGMIFTSVNRDLRNPNLNSLLLKNAFTFGLDGWTFLDDNKDYVLTGTLIGSYINGSKDAMIITQRQPYRYFQRPDKWYMKLDTNRTKMEGMYGRVELNKQNGNFYVNTALGMASPGFEYNDMGFQRYADKVNGHLILGYRWFKADNNFRKKSIYFGGHRTSDYEGNQTGAGLYFNGRLEFHNFYVFRVIGTYDFDYTSTTFTRGGPKVILPGNYSVTLKGYSDSKEKLVFTSILAYWRDNLGSHDYNVGIEAEWKPKPNITLSINPEYTYTKANYQWVGSFTDPTATETYGKRYVYGEMTQNTFVTNIRMNWSFTPKLSLQCFVQVLFSVGDYNNFKELAKPNSMSYNSYSEGNSQIEYNSENETYTVDPDGEGSAEAIQFYNPNFNIKSLRGNIVLRWEVMPGSVLYFAWTHDKTNYINPGSFKLGRDFSDLWGSPANNIFLLKFSYWFDV